jgi:hypothetical protein
MFSPNLLLQTKIIDLSFVGSEKVLMNAFQHHRYYRSCTIDATISFLTLAERWPGYDFVRGRRN